ncbi:hypothetical protein BT96DRAFT_1006153 [Gymnopus androsaceus JB14]|uniref:Uncharacterized protein n=1 Tax=Gymnopus androsaceus JB14 TaxID=1447944 RepID=A0A6A4GM18_9AGAR|nr:hypothetical protein BT96DRAFT_1006153 [Gymnopus androsaceus JB14]
MSSNFQYSPPRTPLTQSSSPRSVHAARFHGWSSKQVPQWFLNTALFGIGLVSTIGGYKSSSIVVTISGVVAVLLSFILFILSKVSESRTGTESLDDREWQVDRTTIEMVSPPSSARSGTLGRVVSAFVSRIWEGAPQAVVVRSLSPSRKFEIDASSERTRTDSTLENFRRGGFRVSGTRTATTDHATSRYESHEPQEIIFEEYEDDDEDDGWALNLDNEREQPVSHQQNMSSAASL